MPDLALYREVVLDHYRTPRHREPLPDPDGSALVHNPVCGDQVRVEVRLADHHIAAVSSRTRGCSIAVAAGSVMCELVQGVDVQQVAELRATLQGIVEGGEAPAGTDFRLQAFAGVAPLRSRRRCALLAWEALEQALEDARPS